MNLAFAIFRYFPFGGLQRDMMAIAREAAERGHRVTIFCGEWEGEHPNDIDVVITQASVIFNTAGIKNFIHGFSQVFRRQDFDLLVGFNKMPGLDIYFCGDSSFAKKAFEERNFFYRLTPRARLYLEYEKAIFDRFSSTRILQLSNTEQLTFMRYYGTSPRRFHNLPPGISRSHVVSSSPLAARKKIRAEFSIPARDKVLLCAGSGFKTKGLDRSIAILAQLASNYGTEIHLIVVGEDKRHPFNRQAQTLGLSKQIYFAGGRQDIADFYQAADLLLHPAYREAAGNVLLEAMLAGLPVLATDVCGYAHYIHQYQLGTVVSAPHAVKAMAAEAELLLGSEKQQWQMRAAIMQQDATLFSRPRAAVEVIETCAANAAENETTHQTSDHNLILRDELVSWAQQDIFEQVEHLPGQVARAVAERETLKFEWCGINYYRKLHRGVKWSEAIKNWLCLRWPITGARNEWDAINALPLLGVKTLTGLAFGEQSVPTMRCKSFLVTRELRDVVQLDHHLQQPSATIPRRDLVSEVANIARRMHSGGINHRDFYLCHFMLALPRVEIGSTQTKPEIYLMDLHRAQWRQQVPRRWLIKDIGSLYYSALAIGVTKRDIYRFLRIYFGQPLAVVFLHQRELLAAIEARATKTYRRDLKRAPQLPVSMVRG